MDGIGVILLTNDMHLHFGGFESSNNVDSWEEMKNFQRKEGEIVFRIYR